MKRPQANDIRPAIIVSERYVFEGHKVSPKVYALRLLVLAIIVACLYFGLIFWEAKHGI
jgi:hypothetical protein